MPPGWEGRESNGRRRIEDKSGHDLDARAAEKAMRSARSAKGKNTSKVTPRALMLETEAEKTLSSRDNAASEKWDRARDQSNKASVKSE
jgi:hypothetical protein